MSSGGPAAYGTDAMFKSVDMWYRSFRNTTVFSWIRLAGLLVAIILFATVTLTSSSEPSAMRRGGGFLRRKDGTEAGLMEATESLSVPKSDGSHLPPGEIV